MDEVYQITCEYKFPHFYNALAGQSFLSMSGSGPAAFSGVLEQKSSTQAYAERSFLHVPSATWQQICSLLQGEPPHMPSHLLCVSPLPTSATSPPGGLPGPLSLGNGQCFPLVREFHSVMTGVFSSPRKIQLIIILQQTGNL